MFKAFGDFISRTPWWAMILLGFSTLLLLVMISVPAQIIRMSESGANPDERRAIKREIDRAVGDSALNVAEQIVRAIKDGSNDPSRQQELSQALAEIAQARKEIFNAQREATSAAQDAIKDAKDAALEAAREAAEAELETAREARESVEETRREVIDKLKSTGADIRATQKALDDTLQAARLKEQAAKDAVKKLAENQKRGLSFGLHMGDDGFKVDVDPNAAEKAGVTVSVDESGVKKKITLPKPDLPNAPNASVAPKAGNAPVRSPVPPALPAAPAAPAAGGDGGVDFDGHIGGTRLKGNINIGEDGKIGIHIPSQPLPPLPPLPPELRDSIHAKVASDVARIGVGSVLILVFIPIFIMLLVAKYFIDRSRRATAVAEQKTREADASNSNRQITEARLQALQAQVEPHFLYNTLANVQALTEVDPGQANKMTGHLIQYLRSSLPKMRENTSTVGQEVELVRSYLNILKMRMGERLAFDIDCPADLMSVGFPPMMLPSLVENAIKHGLEPQREGGRIDVVVQRMFIASGERIRVSVKDTGRGLTDVPTQAGSGVGLSNIRERLIAIYGDAAKLTLESNDPKGVVASIEIPVETNVAGVGVSGIGGQGPTVSASAGASISAPPPTPKGWWGRARHAAAATHGVWAKIMSVTFITLMIALAVVFGLMLAALYTGMLPIQLGDAHLGGVEGKALGTVLLLAAFAAVALALLVVVGVLYGLGLLAAGLLIFIPLIVLVGSVPALAPFILIGLAVYWFWWRKREKNPLD